MREPVVIEIFLANLVAQQRTLNALKGIRYFDHQDECAFLEAWIQSPHNINVLNCVVKSVADIQVVPSFTFRTACINLQTLTVPLDDGRGRRVVDLDAPMVQGSTGGRSVSCLAGLRQIIGDTAFGRKSGVFWLLQELKCPSSTFSRILRPLDPRSLSACLSYDADVNGPAV